MAIGVLQKKSKPKSLKKGLSKDQLERVQALQKEYEEKKKAIESDSTNEQMLFRESWKPAQYKYERDLAIQEIKRQRQGGLVYQSEEAYDKAISQVEEHYQKKIAEFRSGSRRVEAIKEKYSNADAILTSTERISIYKWMGNNNTLIFGGSGCGKTRNYLIPNILQAHSSYVITDPKGEILEKTGYFLEKVKGYNIRVLNLDSMKSSDYYNPFHYIHPEREGYEERVLSLIETIIMNTNGGENKGGNDPFWEQAEKCFLQALFFFTCVYFSEEEQNINTFLKLMAMLKLEEENDNKKSPLDLWVKEEFIPKYGVDHIGVQQFNEFRDKASGKTAKSIVMSAVARFAPFRTKEIRRILSADNMNLELLGEEKTAIFVVVPPTDTTFNFMSGMLFSQMFQELQYCATQVHKAEGQRLPVPVRFLLDEFANTCKIPQFVQIIAYARSFGIGICPILQSLEQLKKMFDKDWGVVIDNCWSMLYLGGVTYPETLEYLVKLVGKGTFDKKSTSQTKGRQGSHSTSYDKIGRELLDMSEIRQLPPTDCLLFVGGRPAFWSKKYDYPSHENYIWTSDGNPRFHYDYTPVPIVDEEERLRAEEEAVKKRKREKTEQARKEADAVLRELAKKQGQEDAAQILEKIDREADFLVLHRPTNSDIGTFINASKKGEIVALSGEDLSTPYVSASIDDPYVQAVFESEDSDSEFVHNMASLDNKSEKKMVGVSLEKSPIADNSQEQEYHGDSVAASETVTEGMINATSDMSTDVQVVPNVLPLSAEDVPEIEEKVRSGEVVLTENSSIADDGYVYEEDSDDTMSLVEDDISFDSIDF